MMDEAPEHGLDVAWVEDAEKPKHSHSVGEPAFCLQNLQKLHLCPLRCQHQVASVPTKLPPLLLL